MILKKSIIYLSSSILSQSIPFLLLPVMTQYLSPQEYGTLSIYLIMLSIYSAFIGMNMQVNISKNFFKISKNELSLYIGNIFIILMITFIFYLLLTYILSFYFSSIFSIELVWFFVIPFISIMTMINTINTTILRNEQKAYLFGLFEISNSFIKVFFTVLFLVTFSLSWYSQIIGILVSSIVFFIIGIFYIYKKEYITIKFNKKIFKSILGISFPLIPHLLGGLIIAMSDRLFIEQMVSIEAVGIYSVGYMFGMVVMLFTDAFIKAWSPWFYKNLANPTLVKKKKIIRYTYIYIITIFILAFLISIIGEFILPYFVDEKFYGAGKFILWVSIGYAVQGVYKIFFPYLVHISKTSFLAFSTVIAAILNLMFNYILIKEFGTVGAAYATIISFSVSAVLVFWYQNKNYYMPWGLSYTKEKYFEK